MNVVRKALHDLLVLPQHSFALGVEDFERVEDGLLGIGACKQRNVSKQNDNK